MKLWFLPFSVSPITSLWVWKGFAKSDSVREEFILDTTLLFVDSWTFSILLYFLKLSSALSDLWIMFDVWYYAQYTSDTRTLLLGLPRSFRLYALTYLLTSASEESLVSPTSFADPHSGAPLSITISEYFDSGIPFSKFLMWSATSSTEACATCIPHLSGCSAVVHGQHSRAN